MLKRTAGPWHVYTHSSNFVMGPDNRKVAMMSHTRLDEVAGNAALIAAAPDYDVAARTLARFRDAGERIPEVAWQALYTAIEKASGAS